MVVIDGYEIIDDLSNEKNRFVDLTNKQFGDLTVLGLLKKKSGRREWLCQCKCGNYRCVETRYLNSGSAKRCIECGKENVKQGTVRANKKKAKHYLTGKRIYNIWRGMKLRCTNPKTNGYANYGGRGIKYCKEWEDFTTFKNWAYENGYDDTLTLDRIDNNKDYSPDNCKFSTLLEQSNNKRTNCFLTYNGETHTISEWSRIVGIKENTIKSRIKKYGWSIEDALTIKPQ